MYTFVNFDNSETNKLFPYKFRYVNFTKPELELYGTTITWRRTNILKYFEAYVFFSRHVLPWYIKVGSIYSCKKKMVVYGQDFRANQLMLKEDGKSFIQS